jgi:hypothetical protein
MLLNHTLTGLMRGGSRGAPLVAALCLLSGCGAGGPSTALAPNSTGKDSSPARTQDASAQSRSPNRCALLTDDEVRDAIGPHGAGSSDINNEWGLEGCGWTASTAQKVEGYPNGWFDTVEVALFEGSEKQSWARGEAKGEPVKGFVEGALYDGSYGQLWFNCARDRFCVVKARTASGGKREQIALQLAQLIEKRLE